MIRIIGFALIIIAFLIIIVSICSRRQIFFNIREIIGEHIALFDRCRSQYIVFYGAPLLLSVGLALIYNPTAKLYDSISVIISVISLPNFIYYIISMLLAVLAIITSFDYSNYTNENTRSNILNVVKETTNAIMFETIICVLLLLYGMVVVVVQDVVTINAIVNRVLTGVTVFLFSVLILDLLIVVKRISRIIDVKLSERNNRS